MPHLRTLVWVDGDWEVVEIEGESDPTLNETFIERECNGQCLTGYDVGVPGAGIAYPHPQCPLHSWDWLFDDVKNEDPGAQW